MGVLEGNARVHESSQALGRGDMSRCRDILISTQCFVHDLWAFTLTRDCHPPPPHLQGTGEDCDPHVGDRRFCGNPSFSTWVVGAGEDQEFYHFFGPFLNEGKTPGFLGAISELLIRPDFWESSYEQMQKHRDAHLLSCPPIFGHHHATPCPETHDVVTLI